MNKAVAAEVGRINSGAFISIATQNCYGKFRYNALGLQGRGVVGEVDPRLRYKPFAFAAYWPGGIGNSTRRFATQTIDGESATSERQFMRDLLATAAIGQTTLATFELHQNPAHQQKIEAAARLAGTTLTDFICRDIAPARIPLSLIVASRVFDAGGNDTGDRAASLHVPVGIPPTVALEAIQLNAMFTAA